MKDTFRLGIIGGMGPLAGVLFQKNIIDATPAHKDQEHIPVVCFTNPTIPDRTLSLEQDSGARYVKVIIESIEVLDCARCTHLVIPCLTAHARFAEIQSATQIPIFNLVETTLSAIRQKYPSQTKIGLLATDGTVREKIFQNAGTDFSWVLPDQDEQKIMMEAIYAIKGGVEKAKVVPQITLILKRMQAHGAKAVVLGCTELSLIQTEIAIDGLVFFDPLTLVSEQIVQTFTKAHSCDIIKT